MKLAYLKEADQEEVARTVREVLQNRGARITEHTRSHTRFDGVRDDDSGFTKGGYVGTYQHVGEREMQLRFDVKATITRRMLWRTVTVELLVLLLLLLWNPSPNTWVVAGALLWIVLVATALLHLLTRRSSNRLEEMLLDATLEELQGATTEALRQEDRELQRLEEEVEAQVLGERLKAKRRQSADGTDDTGDPSDSEGERRDLLERIRGLRERIASARAEDEDAGEPDPDEARREKLERIQELRRAIEERKRALDDDG